MECPAYGAEDLRCWQTVGTYCGESPSGDRIRLLEDCRDCTVFQTATQNPTDKMGELFNNMMFSLDRKMEQILEVERGLETRVQEATRQLRESQARLVHQEKMAALGLLASGIAHEVGNPLASISSLVQLIRRRIGDPGNEERLTAILTHINRISGIVRELVDFSRPSRKGTERVFVQEVLRSAVAFLKYNKAASGVRLVTDFDEEIPAVVLVRDSLLQVFMNLILNAVDAMEGNGTLTLKTGTSGDWICIEISDTGPGVPPEIVPKIFEPFFTTKEVGHGTGLGLFVSYGIIENFHGRIEIESTPGKGSTFRVLLPVEGDVTLRE
jgi:signal transduction histidine kinase